MIDQTQITCIIHPGRVGSTVVSGMLEQLEGVASAGEIYHNHHNGYLGTFGQKWSYYFKDYIRFYEHYLRQFIEKQSSRRDKIKHLFFEYKPYYGSCEREPNVFVPAFATQGVDQFILLYRRNYLRRLVSLLISQQSNIWHTRTSLEAAKSLTIDVNRVRDGDIGVHDTTLEQAFSRYEAYIERIRTSLSHLPHEILIFEDEIAQDPSRAVFRLCEFCDIPPSTAHPKIVRQNPWPLSQIIENFDEVKAHLKGSRFASFCDE